MVASSIAKAPSGKHQCVEAMLDVPTRSAKAFNFLLHGGLGSFYFFQPLLLARRGVPKSLIGAVLGLRPIIGTLVTPLWSAGADAFGVHCTLHVIGLVFGSCSRVLFRFVPIEPIPLLAAAIVSEALICAVVPLGDAAVFLGLERLGRPREQYAFQRLWGAVAAGIFLPFTGALLTASPRDAAWTIVLGLTVCTLCLNACVVPTLWQMGKGDLPTGDTATADSAAQMGLLRRPARSRLHALLKLQVSPASVARCGLFFTCGAFHAVTEGFLFLYLARRRSHLRLAPGPSRQMHMSRALPQAAAPEPCFLTDGNASPNPNPNPNPKPSPDTSPDSSRHHAQACVHVHELY